VQAYRTAQQTLADHLEGEGLISAQEAADWSYEELMAYMETNEIEPPAEFVPYTPPVVDASTVEARSDVRDPKHMVNPAASLTAVKEALYTDIEAIYDQVAQDNLPALRAITRALDAIQEADNFEEVQAAIDAYNAVAEANGL